MIFCRNEATAVLLGSNPESLHKRPPETVGITIANGIGDALHRRRGVGQSSTGFVETQPLDERRRRAPESS